MESPLPFTWDGEHFVPMPRFAKECDRRYVVGEVYMLGEQDVRNMAAHRAFFASVGEAWKNLPEEWGSYFKSPDHLRKWCLIQEGYCTQSTFAFDSIADARAYAKYAKAKDEDFILIDLRGNVVTIFTAESQRVLRNGKGMSAERFRQSKADVTRHLDGMLGVRPGTTAKQRQSA